MNANLQEALEVAIVCEVDHIKTQGTSLQLLVGRRKLGTVSIYMLWDVV